MSQTGVKRSFKTCVILLDLHCLHSVIVILSSTVIGSMCMAVSIRHSILFIKGSTCLIGIRTPRPRARIAECMQSICPIGNQEIFDAILPGIDTRIDISCKLSCA